MQQKNKLIERRLFYVIFLLFLGFFAVIGIGSAKAQDLDAEAAGNITTSDWKAQFEQAYNTTKDAINSAKAMVQQADKWLNDALGARTYKNALKYFLNTLAYDTAEYLASGGEGQKPMFITEGWGEYLKNVGDNAAGSFINDVVSDQLNTNFNLCEPDPSVKFKIGLGLTRHSQPSAPDCSFTEMKKNWEDALDKDSFINDFQDMFNPYSNDLGIALILHTGIEEEISKEVNSATNKRLANEGWLDVTDPISGNTKTPATGVQEAYTKAVDDSTASEKIHTGDYLADAIGIFMNTLAGRLMEEWLKEGLSSNSSGSSNPSYGVTGNVDDYEAAGGGDDEDRFADLVKPNFSIRADYNILSELVSCPDPTKAGPTNCVITENFRQAVIENMTVGEAMRQGYLNTNGVFGFASNGLEPSYNEGYPYRSMIILRKYRIIPVGWELAAQYIHDNLDSTGGARNLEDMVACFDAKDHYEGYAEPWCRGLVDPNWVLKAPLNYCKREGAGPEILSSQVLGSGDDSSLVINRNENYCADEQACIKENDDGSCELYGYCTDERRRWKFDAESCEPKYNTCQTFRSRDGQTASYLENTLEYCGDDQVGCLDYCEDYDAENGWACDSESGDKLFLNKNVEDCSSENEGCHEFIRTAASVGTNLLVNSSFEDDLSVSNLDISWANFGTQAGNGYHGSDSLILNNDLSTFLHIDAGGYTAQGEIWSFSFYAKNCDAGTEFGLERASEEVFESDDWAYNKIVYTFPDNDFEEEVDIFIDISPSDTDCQIDAIKLERGSGNNVYSDYRESGLVYQKLKPDYLSCDGDNPDAGCENYIDYCEANDVGCELYTSATSDVGIPAKVSAWDYCDAECVGYNTYIQTQTTFDSQRAEYFIPSTAESCSADAAGCEEFTNLDSVGEGGEQREYYKYLRQCTTEDDDCEVYYTWEGSDESGYQLKVFNFKSDGNGPVDVSADSTFEGNVCTEETYNLVHNPMCREYYDTDGEVYYRFFQYTVTCSEDCHAYRLNGKYKDPEIEIEAGCIGDNRNWDGEQCIKCINGGVWHTQQDACIYMAIPGEGEECSAAQVGCREYSGNSGNNERILFVHDFEDEDSLVWQNGELSSEAVIVGEHSYKAINNSINYEIGEMVSDEKAYIISFLAKSGGANDFESVRFSNGSAEAEFVLDADDLGLIDEIDDLDSEWRIYNFYLDNLVHGNELSGVSDSEQLIIEANGLFYIDNIKLTEIIDRYYLKKGTWQTPMSCNQDIKGDPYPLVDLGCDEYYDRSANVHYLKSFSKLCQEKAVGCELMIDTHNYSNYEGGIWGDADETGDCEGDEPECIKVEDDSFVYAVYDENKQCFDIEKGCKLLGTPSRYLDELIYSDIYLKDDPDVYSQILCEQGDVGCEEWYTNEGNSYFKDPGEVVCEWRQQSDTGSGGFGWFKKRVKRCTDDNSYCLSNNDCNAGASCQIEELADSDISCSVSSFKTAGFGGQGNRIYQPAPDSEGNWVGLCPASQSECTEYIDPVSRFFGNMVFNSDFGDIDGDGDSADGWESGRQEIELKMNTLYRLAGKDNPGTVTLECGSNLYYLSQDNELVLGDGSSNSIELDLANSDPSNEEVRSLLVYSGGNENCDISVSDYEGQVELKKVAVDYQIRSKVDKTSCNGIVDFENGCVLFDERSQEGSAKQGLKWDADLTIDDQEGTNPLIGDGAEFRDSNIILKVKPDRVCDEWLACRSFIKDADGNNVCFDIGLCDGVDDNGDCNSFLMSDTISQRFRTEYNIDYEDISNMTGYTQVGHTSSLMNKAQYPMGAMEQLGEVALIGNSNFEIAGENGYPMGWTRENGSWDESVFKIIDNPIEAQAEGIGGAPEGKSFIKLGSIYRATSEYVDVMGSVDYTLTARVNTINLSNGTAAISIEEYDGVGDLKKTNVNVISLASGNKWTFTSGRFRTLGSTRRIRVILHSQLDAIGNFYFDNIEVRPALKNRDDSFVPQTCRLYPESDSLSCEYFEDSGKKKKGLRGYCLEYDRYPGSSDVCLMWYPIDKVKGDGIEEGIGYLGKFPVYYCTKNTEVNTAVNLAPSPDSCAAASNNTPCTIEFYLDDLYSLPPEDPEVLFIENIRVSWGGQCSYYFDIPDFQYPVSGSVRCGGSKWYSSSWSYDPSTYRIVITGSAGGWGSCGGPGSCGGKVSDVRVTLTELRKRCDSLVQTVTPVATNKAWLGRVYEGSYYEASCNQANDYYPFFEPEFECTYSSDDSPFGSMYPPDPLSNPFEWDTDDDEIGNQQIYYVKTKYSYENINGNRTTAEIDENYTKPRSGQFYNIPDIQRLFAQSYGSWTWADESVCVGGENNGQSCSGDDCIGGTCEESSGSVCLNSINAGQSCDPGEYDCPTPGDVCSYYETSEIIGYKCGGTGYTCCDSGLSTAVVDDCASGLPCSLAVDGSYHCNGDTGNDLCCPDGAPCEVCSGGGNDGEIVDVVECEGSVTCDGVSSWGLGNEFRCDISGEPCCVSSGDSATCGVANVCSVDSDNAGEVCSANDCPGGECVIGNGQYIRADMICQGGTYEGRACSENGDCPGSYCINQNWSPPSTVCPSSVRGNDICAIPPKIFNIMIDKKTNQLTINKNGFINLTFNSKVDSEQLPLVMYSVDWGDNGKTVVSGVKMRDRPNADNPETPEIDEGNPHSLYHLYSYWDLKQKNAIDQTQKGLENDVYCGAKNSTPVNFEGIEASSISYPNSSISCPNSSDCCVVKPRVIIKDNWGWCNNATNINVCGEDQWIEYTDWIMVREK